MHYQSGVQQSPLPWNLYYQYEFDCLLSISIFAFQVCKGYSNWKDATTRIRNHELSACHREAVDMIIRFPATTQHIGQHLSQQYASETAKNRRALLKILSSLRFLARQAL